MLLGLSPAGALADRGDRYAERCRDEVRVGVSIGDRPVLIEERTTRVWIEPVYRTVYDQVWIEPVYRDECDRVWVPDQYAIREVVVWDCGRRIVRRQRVLVCPGHFEDVHRRVLVCAGRWETVARQELVCAGHWKTRTERVPVAAGGGFNLDIFARVNR